MTQSNNKILRYIVAFTLLFSTQAFSQTEIWKESFDTPEKGYWGGGNDLDGISSWTINASSCTLTDVDDYIKTVSTSGGRMEAKDIDGEAVWTSEQINISEYSDISIYANISETGSSTNANKYVKIYYILDSGTEIAFATNGENIGNFGSNTASQNAINGNSLKIIVKINNPNSGDRTIFDEIIVNGTKKANNADSELTAGTQAEPDSIFSSQNTIEKSLQVLDFTLSDAGSGDNLASIIKELSINQGDNNKIADWQQVISGAVLLGNSLPTDGLEANISTDKLQFEFSPSLSIADGTNATYKLKIFLKTDLSAINDNDSLDFALDCNNIVTDENGSSFAAGNISSGLIITSIKAEKLKFQELDSMILSSTNFALKLVACDANGNIDTDFNKTVSLSINSDSVNLTSASGLSKTASGAYTQWTNLQVDKELSFTINASVSGLPTKISPTIISANPSKGLHEDFEDGDLTSWWYTNDWTNTSTSAITGGKSLKHNLKDVQSKSFISHNLKNLDLDTKTVVWKFNLKNGNWDPTTKNGFWFYLLANDKNLLSDTIDGYAIGVQLNASGSKDYLTLWKVADGEIDTALITSDFDWGSNDLVGIKVERSSIGEWTLSYCENAEFSNIQIAGLATNTDYKFHDCCGLVFKFEGSTYRAGELWMDDVTVYLDSKDSELTAGTQAEPDSIFSSQNTIEKSLQVLDFTLSDAGSGDNLASIIKELSINQGDNNKITDWQQVISGAVLLGNSLPTDGLEASISTDKLQFTFLPHLAIADGTSETYRLKIYLKTDLSAINDNDSLDFALDCNNIVTDENGSSFAAGNISSGLIITSIKAEKLKFQELDSMILSSTNFALKLVACDANGNIDTDFNKTVSLSINSDSVNLTSASGLSKTASGAYTQWTDLQVDKELSFTINASVLGLPTKISPTIISANPSKGLHEDFEDGDLTSWWYTNDWTNTSTSAITGNKSLKHNLENVQSKSFISHNLSMLDLDKKTVVWKFNLKNGNWDPTTQNGFWFYLLANDKDLLSDTIDGYAVGVQLNESGSKDYLTLWKVADGEIDTALITSEFDWGSNDLVGIKVERSSIGEWTLSYCENAEFSNIQIAGSATNTDYKFHDCCGLVFKFEGSTYRAGELWMDDISVALDTIAPTISKIFVNDKNSITIHFSEIIDKNTAENIDNYIISNFGKPNSAILANNKYSVKLTFDNSFEAQKQYSITVANIYDKSDNKIIETTESFIYKPFVVKNVFVLSNNELQIEFSHPLDEFSATNLNNFNIDNSIGKPVFAKIVSDSLLNLQFVDFQKNINYTLSLSNIKSNDSLIINKYEHKFEYYPGNAFDLIINELMVDISPEPPVLPNHKYIEIYNRSEHSINLNKWKIQLGNNKAKTLKRQILEPKEFLIICSYKYENDFKYYGNAMGILSESQLSVTGTSVNLTNPEGEMIDYVNYSDSWYSDDSKKSGGWSLERIDSKNLCGEKSNWQASMDFKGGTPGAINSIQDTNKDTVEFRLLNAKALSSYKLMLNFSKNVIESTALNPENYQLNGLSNQAIFIDYSDTSKSTIILQFAEQFINAKKNTIKISKLQDFCANTIKSVDAEFSYFLIYPREVYSESSSFVKITFSEEVEIVTAQVIENYTVDKGMGKPKAAYKHSLHKNEVYLEFANDFKNQTYYKLSIANVKDLYGNIIKPVDLKFSYFSPSKNDVVINEVLFNPKPQGVDFVEILNNATMPVDLNQMFLARRNDEGEIESIKQLSNSHKMLEKGRFLCISADSLKTKQDYPAAAYDEFLQLPVLPAYNDDLGTVVLMYEDLIIDEFAYNENMHFALIANNEGISLERIDPLKSSNDPDNWHSAASTVGFASPANKNSQYKMLAKDIDKDVIVEPETFSPDNDGRDDIVFIKYKFQKPGYVANISIFDANGLLIKRIAKNELLATEGEFSWDGLHTNNTKARIGIYVIYFEVFNLDGVVKKTKKVCVLAKKLK